MWAFKRNEALANVKVWWTWQEFFSSDGFTLIYFLYVVSNDSKHLFLLKSFSLVRLVPLGFSPIFDLCIYFKHIVKYYTVQTFLSSSFQWKFFFLFFLKRKMLECNKYMKSTFCSQACVQLEEMFPETLYALLLQKTLLS